MILERNEFTPFEEFAFDLKTNTKLTETAYRALYVYDSVDIEFYDKYVVIRVGSYYAITKIVNECRPIEVSEFVQPFDEDKVYPLQKVKKVIDWVY